MSWPWHEIYKDPQCRIQKARIHTPRILDLARPKSHDLEQPPTIFVSTEVDYPDEQPRKKQHQRYIPVSYNVDCKVY